MDGIGSPAALDWDPVTATLWVADRLAGGFPFAFYRGALLPAWAGRMISGDVLLDGGAASTPAFIVAGRDGAIYYGIARAVGRLAPVAGP